MDGALSSGKCKNQTKAPKRSVGALKWTFKLGIGGVLPACLGSFEPKWAADE
ncbi:hypothetical protein PCL1606_57120 [Pseudomonas chlororaphis]|uniref:Uncharacterized protein n=1 Tax=Pseudomonas chlororaphis TaxID=587753 RepID=A0A0D5Y873_9PSED|nr:hypothetical protein PCL1606_57120 [Pseudomonas chlororaphis]